MKKIIIIVLVLLNMVFAVNRVSTYKAFQKDHLGVWTEVHLDIEATTEPRLMWMLIDASGHERAISLKSNTINIFKKSLEKYYEWDKKAKDLKVSLTKDITNFTMFTMFYHDYGDEMATDYNAEITLTFISKYKEEEKDKESHFVLQISKLVDRKNYLYTAPYYYMIIDADSLKISLYDDMDTYYKNLSKEKELLKQFK